MIDVGLAIAFVSFIEDESELDLKMNREANSYHYHWRQQGLDTEPQAPRAESRLSKDQEPRYIVRLSWHTVSRAKFLPCLHHHSGYLPSSHA